MPQDWDHERDFAIWETIAEEAHSRHSRQTGAYVRSQSIVERPGHELVAGKAATALRVLEIGVGGGEHLVFRTPSSGSEEYVGLDISPEYARICRDKFGIEVVVADMAEMPFEDGRFDCVIAMSLLEHVQNLTRALAEVNRVLAPGGSFLVMVPTNGSLAVGAYKRLMSYPTMRRRGIKRPDLVWHHLNVNGFKRVRAELARSFDIVAERGVPWAALPWWLSPLWHLECRKR